ncbi:hypothetical protein F511_22531 [Dorcoceras hygrometricum]|uniref:Uncharacterized protein n=1 Tax=Dorcoceras hygrometricum TaxID=472368 RepID=A0A2Z7CHQ6_9LAMI|nr:hypothetical protein F511_22531 [Dorcoceras hygrometricum]
MEGLKKIVLMIFMFLVYSRVKGRSMIFQDYVLAVANSIAREPIPSPPPPQVSMAPTP